MNLVTGTALSVGIEPTSNTQYRRSLLFLTLASVNELSGSFAVLQRSALILRILASTAKNYIGGRNQRVSEDTA